jgi:hypothetical protein
VVGVGEAIEKAFTAGADVGGDFGEPNNGFDSFDLAEKGADAAEVVGAPVLEEAGGFGSDLPVIGIG